MTLRADAFWTTLVCIAGLPAASVAGDVALIVQQRLVQARANWSDTIGNNIEVIDQGEAPGFGPWIDSRSANSGFGSWSDASLASDVSDSVIHAVGTASARSPQTSILQTASGSAHSYFLVRFSVSTPTLVQYNASIPIGVPRILTPPYITQSVFIGLRHMGTGEFLSRLVLAWGQPSPVPPVTTAFVLQPGEYEVEGEVRIHGGGNHALTVYQDAAQFRVSLSTCYANCDASTGSPLLSANDFQCFLNRFAEGSPYANCDGSTGTPELTPNDFQCYMSRFAAGCT